MSKLCRLLVVLLFVAALPVLAQPYPSKPIKFISPYPPGGPTDILARLIGAKLQASLGQPVIVGTGRGRAATSAPTTSRSSRATATRCCSPRADRWRSTCSLYKSLPYDPATDLVPVVHVASVPLMLVVHPSLKVNSVKELIALGEGEAGRL